MSTDLAAGTILHRYRVDGVLGRGGMGVVYRVTPLEGGEVCAVKTMHPEVAARPGFRKRFLREARAAMAVGHPSIVRIFEVFEHEGVPMLAMEMLEGESLEVMLEREGKIPLARLAPWLVQVTSAVGTAHALGIVHRDIKPDNIFIRKGGDTLVKVLDFGIAKFNATEGAAAQTAALTRTGTMMGTPFYMSPEQAFGEKKIDQRADIWSLGVLTYRCLSGVLPTDGVTFGDVFRKVVADEFPPLRSLAPEVPDDVAALVHRMTAKIRDDRPWDLREVHAVLERYARLDRQMPSFGTAIEPFYEETTNNNSDPGPAPSSTEAKPVVPLALTPASLKLGQSPTGTVMLEPPTGTTPVSARPSNATPVSAPRPQKSSSMTWLVLVAVLAIAALVAALALR